MFGARITDAVAYWARRGEPRGAVRAVRSRRPDKFRWRWAVATLSQAAGKMHGLDRLRIEEPVREVVVDLDDRELQREVVLDARRHRVDFDRGELLPRHRMGDLRRMAYVVGADIRLVQRHVRLPDDFDAPIDTAGVALVSRAYGEHFRKRAEKLWLALPEGTRIVDARHRAILERARKEFDFARRWTALSRALLGQAPPKAEQDPFSALGERLERVE